MTSFKKYKIQEIDNTDSSFPEIFKSFKKPIVKLRFRGTWKSEIFKNCIAVVGSRHNTRYGIDIIDKFLPALVAKKYSIISGFMYGIDTLAHKKTLELGGITIAVLGSGLDVCTPPQNEKLYVDILEKEGLVISEYDDSFKATTWSFPQRNRIKVGLANRGVLVVEASVRSGSLITARIANEMARDVYAVPGSIFSKTSGGCNSLIAELKANLVTTPEDILGLPKPEGQQMSLLEELTPEQLEIIKILQREESGIDQLAHELHRSSREISAVLSILGLLGYTEEVGGKFRTITNMGPSRR